MQLKCALIFVIAATSAEIDIPKKPLKSVNDNLLNYNWDPQNRIAPPPESLAHHSPYIISEQRLNEIRGHFLYWYFDKDTFNGSNDLQRNINTLSPQIQKNFDFQLPFFGKKFNYIRISLNGYLEFSDPPEYYKYPIVFPVKDWPKENDPSFIGIFFSKCRIGINDLTDSDQRSPGVYFRLESDLMTRSDRFGVEVRERVMWDIREGIIGANNFIPKHIIIVTWKNMTFSGGIDAARSTTNTFQVVLATDEISTYALYNYETINWTTHTEAGGETVTGIGGVPAFIGFNAGNGTEAYEYLPYSQSSKILDLKTKGLTNNFPGRHIFRIDEKIILGTCKDVDGMSSDLQFVFAAEFINIFGGTVVNITGPCFDQSKRILCHFDTEDVVGSIIDRHRAFCVQPDLKIEGYIRFEISVGNDRFKSSKKYFVRK